MSKKENPKKIMTGPFTPMNREKEYKPEQVERGFLSTGVPMDSLLQPVEETIRQSNAFFGIERVNLKD